MIISAAGVCAYISSKYVGYNEKESKMIGEYIKLLVRVSNVEKRGSFRAPRGSFFRSGRSLLRRDSKGISTIEYAVLFIIIVIGAIVAWSELGGTVATKTSQGGEEFNRILNVEGSGTASKRPTGNPMTSSGDVKKTVSHGSRKSESNQYYDPR